MPPTGIEPVPKDFQSSVLTNYTTEAKYLVLPVGIEPTSLGLQSSAMTTSAKAALIFFARVPGFEPRLTTSKAVVLTVTLHPCKKN